MSRKQAGIPGEEDQEVLLETEEPVVTARYIIEGEPENDPRPAPDRAVITNGGTRSDAIQRRRAHEARVLLEVATILNSTLDLQAVLYVIMDKAVELLQAEAGSLVLVDEETDELLFTVTAGPGSADLAGMRLPAGTGIVGTVVRESQSIIINEARADRRWYSDLDEQTQFTTRSIIAVPMISQGQTIGVIELLNRRDGEPFDPNDERLLVAFAASAAVAIANARLYEEARRRLAETQLVQDIVLAAASTLDFDLVLERTAEALCEALSIDRLGFLLPDEQDGALVSHPSLAGLAQHTFQLPVEGSLAGQAYRTGGPVLVRDVGNGAACSEQTLGICSVLAVPVQIGNKVIAVLHAQSSQVGAFGEDEVRLCTTVAGHLGMALDNARLYQRLTAQTAELSQAYDELEETNRLGNELVQNVSHELRTPLGLIHGYVHLLLEGELGPLHDSQQTALRVIRDRTATLGRLIHNLTVLRSAPLDVLAPAPVSTVKAARQALAGFSHSAEQAGISFQEELPEGLIPVLGDHERLELAFGHLIDNAIKFSPDGGTVTLRAWSDQNWVYLSVTDQGIGMAPEHLNHIFERFYQIDGTTTRRYSGMGVGLALVWEIIEAHGGTVQVESEPGKGSTFTISLPAAHDRARTIGTTP
jgi:signal transduction histidine kinase